MASVVVQMGHVARTSGATGTHREQEFTRTVGPRLATQLRKLGHRVHLIGADDPVPRSDVFVALHTDGSSNRARRGASVGYPDAAGARLAAAWKRAHQRHGYPGGFLRDNYTPALAGYYGFRKSKAPVRFLAEHGTTTNRADEQWLFASGDACVQAHVDAIGEVIGHPATPTPPTSEEDDAMRYVLHKLDEPGHPQRGQLAAEAPGVWSLLDGPELDALRYAGRLLPSGKGSEAEPVLHSAAGFDAMRRAATGENP